MRRTAFLATAAISALLPTLAYAQNDGPQAETVFDGDLTNGGLAGFVTGGYTKLLDDAKRTPLTSVRGDSDQWLAGAGLAFTF